MSTVIERPALDKVQAFARQARLASVSHQAIEVMPDVAGVLADYLQETLAVAQDQGRIFCDRAMLQSWITILPCAGGA